MEAGRLPPDAVVIRGGECKVEDMTKNAKKHEKDHPGEYALSGFCFPGQDAGETARRAREEGPFYLPQPKMRAVTIGELEDGGFPVVLDEPPAGHVAIMLLSLLSQEQLVRLNGMLGPCIDNPVARR